MIRLTLPSGQVIYVNPRYIVAFSRVEGAQVTRFEVATDFEGTRMVVESPEQILDAMRYGQRHKDL